MRRGTAKVTTGRRPLSATPVALFILILTLAESIAFAQAMHAGTNGRWILPLDDAYIHQQYARQIARGYFFRYNDQDPPSSGNTSLLYPFVLAVAWKLGCRGDGLSAFAFIFGGVLLFFSALLSARLAWRLGQASASQGSSPSWTGLLAAMFLLTNGALSWGFFSGMEGGLFIFLLLATLEAVSAERPLQLALCGGLLALTRPEGAILIGILLVFQGARALWDHTRGRWPLWPWPFLFICCLLHPLLNLSLTGSAIANGIRAKSWLYNAPLYPAGIIKSVALTLRDLWVVFLTGLRPEDLKQLLHAPLGHSPQLWFYMPAILGALGLGHAAFTAIWEWRHHKLRQGTIMTLWIVTELSATALLTTAQMFHYRYQLPAFALGTLAGSLALAAIAGALVRKENAATRNLVLLALPFLAISAWQFPRFLADYGQASHTVLILEVRTGEWIKANLPPGARIALTDAGAIRYYSEHPSYDLVGLTGSAEAALAWRQGAGSTYELIERTADIPSYFATYDDVHALPLFRNTAMFQRELYRVQDPFAARIAVPSDHVLVYAADWHLRHSGESPYQQDVQELVKGLTLVDKLDIADLEDERTHGYRWWNTPEKGGFATEVHQLDYHRLPHQRVLDGGRLLTGGEAFELCTLPGKDLILVGRFLGQGATLLKVWINGHPVGDWGYAPLPGRWQERTLHVPGHYITGDKTHIELRVEAARPDFEFHRPFYYWGYQGDVPMPDISMAHPLHAHFGEGISLLGYDLTPIKTGSLPRLELTLYWQADRPIPGDYQVFVHWTDDRERILAQQDNRPVYGLQPTWLWKPGQIIADPYSLTPSSPLPPGPYTLYIGLYDPRSMERLPIAGGDPSRRLLLASFTLP